MTRKPLEEHIACVESTRAQLDAVQDYAIPEGQASGLLVLHGLAMYARDTARSTLVLLRGSRIVGAAALTRVVVEHAVLAQWLKIDPETRGDLFLRQSEVERHRWFEVILAANFDLLDPGHAALTRIENIKKPRNVAEEFNTPKNLFGDTDMGKQMYVAYRNLSRFVHPSMVTFGRYTESFPRGVLLSTRLQVDQDAEALSFYLASATVMCAVPYLDTLGDGEAGSSLLATARAAGVVTTLVDESSSRGMSECLAETAAWSRFVRGAYWTSRQNGWPAGSAMTYSGSPSS